MESQYNLRSPAVKRLMREAQELREPTELFHAQPIEDNLFEWHFTLRGPSDTEFEGGIYHGRIVLPPEYPMKPPSIIVLTPNGRFEVYKKICLSISGHHPESWQPSWSIRTAMLAIIGFMPTHGNGAIGSLDYTPEERRVLAKKTADWKCRECGSIKNILKPLTDASKKASEEAKELASQINFQGEKKAEANGSKSEAGAASASSQKPEGAAAAAAATATASGAPSSHFPPNGNSSSMTSSGSTLPGFNPQMLGGQFPMPMMPPFMPPMMVRPSNQAAGQNANTSGFPSPFWPNPMMMRPQVDGGGGNTTSGQARMPAWSGMPMMFNPMMASQLATVQAQAAAMMAGTNTGNLPQSTDNVTPATSTPASSSAPASQPRPAGSQVPQTITSSPAASPPRTAPPCTTSSQQPNSAPTTSTVPATPAVTASMPSAQTTSVTSTTIATTPLTTSTIASTTASATASTTASMSEVEGLRQRNVSRTQTGTGNSSASDNSELHPMVPQQSENPVVILMMVLLGLAIVLLIARRLYSMNVWRLDTDY